FGGQPFLAQRLASKQALKDSVEKDASLVEIVSTFIGFNTSLIESFWHYMLAHATSAFYYRHLMM
ncbi:MAG: hypothetical protein KDC66_23560, partial [Phaeodactylibacter sp.]|nr:hypothetical protein [Phaeodactylibacter sp.]